MQKFNALSDRVADQADGLDLQRANHLLSRSGVDWLNEIEHFESLKSTNQTLLERTSSIHGSICLADMQTKGRGRLSRNWVGAQSTNIAMSLGWEPKLAVGSALSLVVGVAVAETLRSFGVVEAGLKWPNDILAGRQKLGGILIEAVNQGSEIYYVIGVGLNLSLEAGEAAKINQAWTDLFRLGYKLDRTELTAELIIQIATNIEAYAAQGIEIFRARWDELHVFNKQMVEFDLAGQHYHGIVQGVDDDGALLMEMDGLSRSFVAGEIKVKV